MLLCSVPVAALCVRHTPHGDAFPTGVGAIVNDVGKRIRGMGEAGLGDAESVALATSEPHLRHSLVSALSRAELAEVRVVGWRSAALCGVQLGA